MNIRYRVELSQTERDEITSLLSGGEHPARKLKRAQIPLAVDAGARDDEIAARMVVGGSTVYHTKRRFVEDNLDQALAEAPRPGAERKLSGKEDSASGGNRLLVGARGPGALDPGDSLGCLGQVDGA